MLHGVSLSTSFRFRRCTDYSLEVISQGDYSYVHNDMSSPVAILARPPTSSLLTITDRPHCYIIFIFISPKRKQNQLLVSLCQPHTSFPIANSPIPSRIHSLLSSWITPSLFHVQLKSNLYHESYPPLDCIYKLLARTFLPSSSVSFDNFFPVFFFCSATQSVFSIFFPVVKQ